MESNPKLSQPRNFFELDKDDFRTNFYELKVFLSDIDELSELSNRQEIADKILRLRFELETRIEKEEVIDLKKIEEEYHKKVCELLYINFESNQTIQGIPKDLAGYIEENFRDFFGLLSDKDDSDLQTMTKN